MKELNFEQMEAIQGGDYGYCQLICHWANGGSGYQGEIVDLYLAWFNNCTAYCDWGL